MKSMVNLVNLIQIKDLKTHSMFLIWMLKYLVFIKVQKKKTVCVKYVKKSYDRLIKPSTH